MSVILYSKGSYKHLANNRLFVQASSYFGFGNFAESLFELNVLSYQNRYSNHETSDEVTEASEETGVDSEFSIKPDDLAALWHLLNRINYQCCEYDSTDGHAEQIYNNLQMFIHRIASLIVEDYKRLRLLKAA